MALLAVAFVQPTFAQSEWTQERLERKILIDAITPDDDFIHFPEPEDVPEREKDAIKEYHDFIVSGGWTTNQLINAFIQAVTNNISDEKWSQEQNRIVAKTAIVKLSQINIAEAKSFIENVCTNNTRGMFGIAVNGMFRYTNFEPEVFDFMRRMCVLTNQYESCVIGVAVDLNWCLWEIPLPYKASATNNLARYHYFVIRHATQSLGAVDGELSRLIPAYSNSIQRLDAMRYVSNTATNRLAVSWANREVQRLSALPTNELNNVSWLEE